MGLACRELELERVAQSVQGESCHGLMVLSTMHPLPDASLTPAEEAFIHGVPLAILRRERPPLGAGPGNPQGSRKETAAVLLPAPHTHQDRCAKTEECEAIGWDETLL